MKIRNEQLESLLLQEPVRKAPVPGGQAFDDVLAQQLEQSGKTAGTTPLSGMAGVAGLNGLDPMLLVEQADASGDAQGDLLENALGQTAGLLDSWEGYAATLSNSQASNRQAWSMLSGMDSQLQQLRGSMGQLGKRGSALEGVINELEVLTATEKFKFNRGDYQ